MSRHSLHVTDRLYTLFARYVMPHDSEMWAIKGNDKRLEHPGNKPGKMTIYCYYERWLSKC